MTFAIDGTVNGVYIHTPTATQDYMYDVLVYHDVDLENTQHTLTIQTVGDENGSLSLFDYAMYT